MNIGKQGERLFASIMTQLGYEVVDRTNEPDYWSKDIDFTITSPTTGLVKEFEVKFDSRINRTHNLYLEISNIHSKGGRGWFEFCEADYLAYGDSHTNTFFVIPMDELKKRVAQLPKRVARCGYDSVGYLVSLEDIKDLYKTL